MDARKLRQISVENFGDRVAGSQDLTAALDDGFTLTDRSEITGKPIVLVGWEISAGIGGDYVEVWALVMFAANDIRKVKFRDGGRSSDGIPATLRRLAQSGINGNVRVVMASSSYEFMDSATGEMMPASRYWFEDPENAPEYEAEPPAEDTSRPRRKSANATAAAAADDAPF